MINIKTICKKLSNKLGALARVTPYMAIEKKKVLINFFFDPQFNYCPLVWMCHRLRNNTKINDFHERYIRLTYSAKNNLMRTSTRRRNSFYSPQELATETYKVKNGYSPKRIRWKMDIHLRFSIICLIKENISPYNLRRHPEFRVPLFRTVV